MTMNSAVPCGIAAPQIFMDGVVDMGLVRAYARRAEELGYHSLWTQEQIIGNTPVLEPVNMLSYLAAVTERIRLGVAVLVLTTRNPVHLAKQLSTLDQMSSGRLIAGVALGGRPAHYRLLDAPTELRARHFVESLRVMNALWTQERATFKGRFWQLDGVGMEPKPVQKPHPPLWFGGRHPDGLRRAARYADGWMGAGSTTPAQFREHVRIIREALDESGRDPATFAISKRVYLAIDDDEARAERRLREWFGQYYGNADMGAQVSIWGGVEKVSEGLNDLIRSGAQMLMLNPAFDMMEHLEALAKEVAPRLRLP
ncbi:MAG: LLM class flavin-dependent oxidoreductase [Chloroflexi bacterium]|nr:LLM class flavin-dependent oxidoreductase [Chloroflexota bacterium]